MDYTETLMRKNGVLATEEQIRGYDGKSITVKYLKSKETSVTTLTGKAKILDEYPSFEKKSDLIIESEILEVTDEEDNKHLVPFGSITEIY